MTFLRWPPKLTTQVGCQKPLTGLSRLKFELESFEISQNVAFPYYVNIFQNKK